MQMHTTAETWTMNSRLNISIRARHCLVAAVMEIVAIAFCENACLLSCSHVTFTDVALKHVDNLNLDNP